MKLGSWPRALALGAAALAVPGCTHLEVHKIDPTKPLPAGSIPYALPKKTFLITATYVLNNCRTVTDNKRSGPQLLLDVETTIDPLAVNEVDEDERYFIPYAQLRSIFKEVNYVVESHASRTLKSFNVTVNDQAGPILTAAIGTAIKFAALGAASEKKAGDAEYCDPATLLALRDVEQRRKALKPPAQSEPPKQAPPAAPKTAAKKAPPKPPQEAEPAPAPKPKPAPSPADNAEQVREINKIVKEKLTTKIVLTWSPQISDLKQRVGSRSVATRMIKPEQAVGRWLSDAGKRWLADRAEAKHTTYLLLDIPTWSHPKEKEVSLQVTEGFVVREPAYGTLRVCMGPCLPATEGIASVDNVIAVSSAALPQLGWRLVLPVRNAMGQNSILDVTMAEDGVLTKLGMRSTSTAATTITNLGTNAEAARAAIQAYEKAKAEALTAAQNKAKDENKLLADCLAAQETILKHGGTPIGSCQ